MFAEDMQVFKVGYAQLGCGVDAIWLDMYLQSEANGYQPELGVLLSLSVSRRRFLCASAVGVTSLYVRPVFAADVEVSDRINPLIGASTSQKLGEGKTFPGPSTPFGLVQLGPDTMTGGDNASGYSYDHTTIEGFSFARMSGVGWYGDFGNFLIMPSTGIFKAASGRLAHPDEGWRSPFDHATETARAGYYSVKLDRYNIRVELTAAPTPGFFVLRFRRRKMRVFRSI
jgi:putative alpha-1,2-mannosidase